MDSTFEHNGSLSVQDREPTSDRIHHDETSKVRCKRTPSRRHLLESDNSPEDIGVATMEQKVLDSCKENATCMERKSELDDCSELSLQNMKAITIKPLIYPSRLKQFDYQPESIMRSSVVGESNIHRLPCRSRKERTVKLKSRYTNVTKRNCHTQQFTKSLPNKKIEVQIHKLCTEVELLNLKVSKQSCNSSFEKSIIKGSKIGVKLCLGTENKPIEYGLSPHVDDVRVEENVVASTDSNMQHTHTEVDNVLLNLTPSISEGTALEKSALSHHQDSSSLTQQELACITAVSHQTRNNHDGATVSPDGQGDDGHVTDCSRATSDQSYRIDAHLHAPEAYKEVNVTSEKVSSSAEPKQPTSTSNNHCGATILADGQGNDRRVIGARSYQNVISDAHTQSIEPYKKDSLTSESVSSLAEPELHSKHVNKINVVCSPPRNNLSAESNRISVINCRSTNFKGSELNRKLHIPNEQERVNQQPVRKKGKHTSGNPCNSEISSKDLRLSGSLKQYMPIRSSAHQYKCDYCDKCFSRKHHVLDHMTIHTGERPHECETCGKCFTQKSHLNVHMRIHTGEKPYKCEKCGMRFIVRDKLNIHMRNHTGEKPYKCETCGRCYAQKSSLTYHMRIHTGKKPYKCEYCEKCFSHKHHAIEHMTIHTGERPYKCDTCGKCFRQKSTCRVHERGHIGDKLYKCETCGASFGIRDDFKSHKLIHPDVKPFKCDTCGRCFKLKSNLKCHMRIHTGEKPYKCETCGISFSLKCNLKRHMKKQHM